MFYIVSPNGQMVKGKKTMTIFFNKTDLIHPCTPFLFKVSNILAFKGTEFQEECVEDKDKRDQ